MPHVDEGLLHAYLDRPVGERGSGVGTSQWREVEHHLAQCSRCRAALEEAARVRDRAAEILRESGPASIRMPPFEEIRRTAPGARRLTALSRMKALGAAASIVLAVALGWVARGALEPTRPGEPAAREAAGAQGSELSGPPAGSAPRAPQQERTVERSSPESRAVGGGGAGAAESRPAPQAAAEQRVERVQRPQLQLAEEPSRPAAVQAAEAALDREQMAQRGVEPVPIAARQAGLPVRDIEIGTWSASTAEGAGAYIGTALAVVPDLETRSFATGVIGGRRAVRVVQDLGEGHVLAITQIAASDEANISGQEGAAGPAAGVTSDVARVVSEIRGRYLITLRAPVSADSLRALLARIPAPRP